MCFVSCAHSSIHYEGVANGRPGNKKSRFRSITHLNELGNPLNLSDPVFEKGIIIGVTLLGLCNGYMNEYM